MNLLAKVSIPFICFGVAAVAQAADFEDYARVVSVTPQLEQVNVPRQECRTEYVQVQHQERDAGGAVVGGLIGGLIGSQVGKGNGRTAATAVGAIAGAIAGDRAENRESTVSEQPMRECRTVEHLESRPNGYAVVYEYRGHTYTSVMPYDPGDRLRLHVSLMPLISH